MNTIFETRKEANRRPNRNATIHFIQKGIVSKRSQFTKAKNRTGNITAIETVCVKLKNDLEWHSCRSEKIKPKKITENISEKPAIPNLYNEIVEKWWLVA
jgi:hypothetical protein